MQLTQRETLMTETVVGKLGRLALWFSPNVIVLIGFVVAIRWIKPSPAATALLSAVMGIFVLGYCAFLGKRESQRWDEVQSASWGFASAHGWLWGGFATLLLLMLPPVMNSHVELVNALVQRAGNSSVDMTNHLAVRLASVGGVVLVLVMQTLAIIIASMVWRRRMGRPGEQP